MTGSKFMPAARPRPDRMKIPAPKEILHYAWRLGWRNALMRGAYVAANRLAAVSICDCFRLRREDINAALVHAEAGHEARFLAEEEARRLAGQLDGVLAEILRQGLAHGDAIHGVFAGECLASIGLYARTAAPIYDDLVVHFDAASRYMYRGYTLAAFRGRRLHALGILQAALELFDQGVPQLVTICERTNYPAVVSVLRMGWQPCGTLYRIGIGPWTRLGQSALARELGMQLMMREMGGPDAQELADGGAE